WAAADYLEAAAHSGHVEEARAVMAEMEALAQVSRSPLLQVHLAYARPLLANDQEAEALHVASLGEQLAVAPCATTTGLWWVAAPPPEDGRRPRAAARRSRSV